MQLKPIWEANHFEQIGNYELTRKRIESILKILEYVYLNMQRKQDWSWVWVECSWMILRVT